jgi:uncharacterized membrane protein YuzA (DUF378 family)
MSDGFWHGPVDFLTLVLMLGAGIELGLIGLFGYSVVAWLFGSWKSYAYDAIGFGAIWQISRQRLFR